MARIVLEYELAVGGGIIVGAKLKKRLGPVKEKVGILRVNLHGLVQRVDDIFPPFILLHQGNARIVGLHLLGAQLDGLAVCLERLPGIACLAGAVADIYPCRRVSRLEGECLFLRCNGFREEAEVEERESMSVECGKGARVDLQGGVEALKGLFKMVDLDQQGALFIPYLCCPGVFPECLIAALEGILKIAHL